MSSASSTSSTAKGATFSRRPILVLAGPGGDHFANTDVAFLVEALTLSGHAVTCVGDGERHMFQPEWQKGYESFFQHNQCDSTVFIIAQDDGQEDRKEPHRLVLSNNDSDIAITRTECLLSDVGKCVSEHHHSDVLLLVNNSHRPIMTMTYTFPHGVVASLTRVGKNIPDVILALEDDIVSKPSEDRKSAKSAIRTAVQMASDMSDAPCYALSDRANDMIELARSRIGWGGWAFLPLTRKKVQLHTSIHGDTASKMDVIASCPDINQ